MLVSMKSGGTHNWNTEQEAYDLFKNKNLNKKEGKIALWLQNVYICKEIHDIKWKPSQKNPLKTKGKRNTVIMTPLWMCTCAEITLTKESKTTMKRK